MLTPTEINLLYGNNQKIGKIEFFKMVRVRSENQVTEEPKKVNTNVWNLDLGQKKQIKKNHARAIGGKFFIGITTRCTKRVIKVVPTQSWKQVSKVRKKSEINVGNLNLGQKMTS